MSETDPPAAASAAASTSASALSPHVPDPADSGRMENAPSPAGAVLTFPEVPVSRKSPAAPADIAALSAADPGGRLSSMDALRGFVMLLMMGEVLQFSKVSQALPGNEVWATLAKHWEHVDWTGCTLHDLIQPTFSFLVGVALPFSLAKRAAEGQPQWKRTIHAFWRALVLVLLGVFLRSTSSDITNWTFEDTLSQIGLGYGFLYLLALRPAKVQWIAFGSVLIACWLLFAVYPARPESGPLAGFAAHWNLNANPAWAFDRWFLNLFPRAKPFEANGGGYSTLSFIPTLATMILGLLAGGVLRGGAPAGRKLAWLILAGLFGIGAGWALDRAGICPVVKRIWTPSWVLFSGGWSLLFLALLYLVMDIWRLRRWAFVLTVVGMNSIAAYLIAHLFQNFISQALPRHFGQGIFTLAGPAYAPFLHGLAVLLIEWILLWWMFRRRLFLKI